MSTLMVILGILAVLAFFVMSVYNTLIKWRNRVKDSFAQIDVQLKRRHDLVPNLIETVKGYAKHEKELLENVTNARAQAVSAGSIGEKIKSENALSETLRSLFMVSENYPDLKANQNFLELQRDLRDTEDKIAASRQLFNTTVREYNTRLEIFPNNIVAGMFNFKEEEFFETDEAEREAPKVKF